MDGSCSHVDQRERRNRHEVHDNHRDEPMTSKAAADLSNRRATQPRDEIAAYPLANPIRQHRSEQVACGRVCEAE
jgi:uncharacterized protein YfaQ (DUF2300 family)